MRFVVLLLIIYSVLLVLETSIFLLLFHPIELKLIYRINDSSPFSEIEYARTEFIFTYQNFE